MKRRIGILTAGGDCPGLNSTMRGLVRSCCNLFGNDMEITGIHNGYSGLINNECTVMAPDDFCGILTKGGTFLGTRRTPFKMMRVIEEDGVDKVQSMKNTYNSLFSVFRL